MGWHHPHPPSSHQDIIFEGFLPGLDSHFYNSPPHPRITLFTHIQRRCWHVVTMTSRSYLPPLGPHSPAPSPINWALPHSTVLPELWLPHFCSSDPRLKKNRGKKQIRRFLQHAGWAHEETSTLELQWHCWTMNNSELATGCQPSIMSHVADWMLTR